MARTIYLEQNFFLNYLTHPLHLNVANQLMHLKVFDIQHLNYQNHKLKLMELLLFTLLQLILLLILNINLFIILIPLFIIRKKNQIVLD